MVGAAGGAFAPKVMPQVEEVLANKVGNVKQILKDGLPKLQEPKLAAPNSAPMGRLRRLKDKLTGEIYLDEI